MPDKYLGQYIARQTSRDLVLWPGYCPTHVMITEDDVKKVKTQFPDAITLTHPECTEPVRRISDKILSTSQMLKFVAQSSAGRFIVATETGILHALKKQNPDAEFIAAAQKAICPNMKKITLEKVLWALEESAQDGSKYKVTVPDEIRTKAKKALDRMVEILP